MENPNADSSSDSTQERLIVKAKRPPRKRWALQSTIYCDRNVDGLPRSRCRRAIFFVGPAHDDPERVIRQWPLQCLGLIPRCAHPNVCMDRPCVASRI